MPEMQKRVLLVDPPANELCGLNTGLGWLAANIIPVVETVKVLGLANIICDLDEGLRLLKNKVRQIQPDIVGFNIHCTTYQTTLVMIRALRTYFDGLIVIGGPHTAYANESIMYDSPETDLVVIGEAEVTFAEICKRDVNQYHDIDGVIFRDEDTLIHNPLGKKTADFTNLAFPDYRLFGISKIHYPYPIATSRGCPFKCCFCNPFMGGGGWRPRPLEDVFAELNFAIETFDIKSFKLVEPVFNLRPRRVVDFCRGLQEAGIRLPWFSASGLRADTLTAESVKAMQQAGCTHVKIGVETLVPKIFKHVNKGESIADIKRAITIVKAAKMPIWGSFIIGLPHDTMDTTMLNFELSKQLGMDFTEWSLLFPYPGTSAYEWMEQNGTIYHTIETAHQAAQDSVSADDVHVACDTPEFPRAERIKAYYAINWKSGNYFFSMQDPDWKKAVTILRGILRYDPTRFLWHMRHIFKLLQMRSERRNKAGAMFDFKEGTFS